MYLHMCAVCVYDVCVCVCVCVCVVCEFVIVYAGYVYGCIFYVCQCMGACWVCA